MVTVCKATLRNKKGLYIGRKLGSTLSDNIHYVCHEKGQGKLHIDRPSQQ